LWYLPFALLVTWVTAFAAANGLLRPGFPLFVWTTAFGCAMIPLAAVTLARAVQTPPFAQWVFVAPAVLLGVSLTAVADSPARLRRAGLIAMVVATAVAVSVASAAGFHMLSVPYAVGITACAAAWWLRLPAGRTALWFGGLAYGVYLVHPLVESALHFC